MLKCITVSYYTVAHRSSLPKPNREFLKKSFNYGGAKLWNSLPLDAKAAESVYQFKDIIRGNA